MKQRLKTNVRRGLGSGADRLAKGPLRGFFAPILGPFIERSPSGELIRSTARQQWRTIALNLGTSLVEAFSEGATFGVIFLAVGLLSSPNAMNWSSNPLVGRIPALAVWMNGLPRTPLFLGLLGLALGLQAAQSLTRYINSVSLGYFAAACRAAITSRIHSQILSLTFPCASRYRVGDLTNYASGGPYAVSGHIQTVGSLLVNCLLVVVYLVVLVGISPWLLLVAIALGTTLTLIQKRLLPAIQREAWKLQQREVDISTRITEDIQGLRLLHSSGQLDAADAAVHNRMKSLERGLRRISELNNVVGPLSSFLPLLAIVIIAALSILLFGDRSTGVLPSLVTFVLALQRLNIRMAGVAGSFTAFANNSAQISRLNEILATGDKQFRSRGGKCFNRLEEGVVLENVILRYAPDCPAALSGISLEIPRGQTVALVGTSGAGKSSIADLLVGLYAPTSGTILIDGIPMDELDLASWQQRIGVVSQDTFLFNASLAENIAFGTPGATRSQIEDAASLAQAAEFIETLPDGYDTLIGERGYRLSGGQRQRISLARAILRNPEFLILDEATSALDSRSERLVQEAIEQFESQYTVLVIAHRLSTIKSADQICVLERGMIVERGTHEDLVSQNGSFASLWRLQNAKANT